MFIFLHKHKGFVFIITKVYIMSSISDLENTNKKLRKQNQKLISAMECMKKEIERLSIILKNRTEDNCLAIRVFGYLGNCRSIRKTAWKYDCDMIDLFNQIPQWDGSHDELKNAEDYLDCLLEAYGRKYYDQTYRPEERMIRSQIPAPTIISSVLADYNGGTSSLYNIADKYNLSIDNLFRILKEHGAIEEETDAIGYAEFYTEYVGGNQLWDGITSLGIIE